MQCCTQLILFNAFLAVTIALPASGQRFWALMRDGKIQTGSQLRHFAEPKQPVALDGRKLLGIEHPVRTVRDTKLSLAEPTARLELINGDVLVGRVVKAITGRQAFPLPDHLVVENVRYTGSVRIRLDWVRGIVTASRPRQGFTPNYLRLTSGSEPRCQSIRWIESGIRLLTDGGILTVPFGQVAELHVPQLQPWRPIYPGAAWLVDEGSSVVRIVTVRGQVISFPRSMVTKEFDRKQLGKRAPNAQTLFATRPAWSLDLLLLDVEDIAWQSYFEACELPLSTLPVVDVMQKAGLHHFPWRRDRNVRGEPLYSGEMTSELGIGMHAFTRLTFELPPRAKTFSTHVGLDRMVGTGGCVHCRIWRDEPTGSPLWERQFLRGSDGVHQVGPLDISDAKHLILEVDFANDNRPQGADPLDVRDSVDWLLPMVRIEPAIDNMESLTQAIPEISGWTISPEQLKRIKLRPAWVKRNNQWGTAIVTGSVPLVLSRQVEVTLQNAWLPVRATCDDVGENRTIWVRANGEKVGSSASGNLGTFSRYRFGQRAYNLSEHLGQTVTVEVVADPHKRSSGELGGVVWDWLCPQPLIQNLPPDGNPIQPDVPLTTLSPIKAVCRQQPIKLVPGKLTSGEALSVQGWPFEDGYGVPNRSEITYQLEPSWQMFVAVIGLAEGLQVAGPFQILLDDKLHWTSERTYARDDPGQQVTVPIPSGHKTITLKLLGDDSIGAWADAGFLR